MAFKLLNLQQKTQEWLDYRATRITSTDAAAILGVSPWDSPLSLYYAKKGMAPPKYVNEAMKRGAELEDQALEKYTAVTGYKSLMVPMCVESLEYPWMMTSLDGLEMDMQSAVEIKCPGERVFNEIFEGRIPEYHTIQCQFHLLVTGFEKIDYFAYYNDKFMLMSIFRDQPLIDKIIEKCGDFYENLCTNTPPDALPTDAVVRSDVEWALASEDYLAVKKDINKILEHLEGLKQKEKECKERLKELANFGSATGCGVKLTRVETVGEIDYSKIDGIQNIDLEKYRKEPRVSWRITELSK